MTNDTLSPEPDAAEVPALRRRSFRLPEEIGVIVALLVMIVVIGVARPRFLNPINLLTILGNTTFEGMLSLGMVFLLTLPSSVGLIVLGRTMIGAIYQGGKFSAYDTEQTAVALSCYALGLAGYSALKVLNPAFYALHDARTPMIVSILSIAVNYLTASLLFSRTHLGHAGLALSTAAVATFGGVALFVILRDRVGGIYGRNLLESVWKITVASAVMGAAVVLSNHWMESWLGVDRLGRLADLAVSIPLGLVVFYAACRALRVSELELAARALAGAGRPR